MRRRSSQTPIASAEVNTTSASRIGSTSTGTSFAGSGAGTSRPLRTQALRTQALDLGPTRPRHALIEPTIESREFFYGRIAQEAVGVTMIFIGPLPMNFPHRQDIGGHTSTIIEIRPGGGCYLAEAVRQPRADHRLWSGT
jgi:hypothetical protein